MWFINFRSSFTLTLAHCSLKSLSDSQSSISSYCLCGLALSVLLVCKHRCSNYGRVPYSPHDLIHQAVPFKMLIILESSQFSCLHTHSRVCLCRAGFLRVCVCVRAVELSCKELRVSFQDQKRNDTRQQSLYIRPAGQLERAVLVMEDCRNHSKSDGLHWAVGGLWFNGAVSDFDVKLVSMV